MNCRFAGQDPLARTSVREKEACAGIRQQRQARHPEGPAPERSITVPAVRHTKDLHKIASPAFGGLAMT
jgi:hypothetical protein